MEHSSVPAQKQNKQLLRQQRAFSARRSHSILKEVSGYLEEKWEET
jgi:hypothetical protein